MARKRTIFGIQNQVEIKKLKTKKSGREKIYIGDFGFHFGHENKMDFVYYCEQRDKPDVQCKASIRLLKESGKIVPRTEHTHNAEKGNIEAQMVKAKLYEESGTHLLENPRDLISRVVGNAPAEVLNRLPKNLDRMVRLMKEQAGVNLKNPKRLNDIDIDQR